MDSYIIVKGTSIDNNGDPEPSCSCYKGSPLSFLSAIALDACRGGDIKNCKLEKEQWLTPSKK